MRDGVPSHVLAGAFGERGSTDGASPPRTGPGRVHGLEGAEAGALARRQTNAQAPYALRRMHTSDLDYPLPDELVARRPPEARDGARLLVLRRQQGTMEHTEVLGLPQLLPPRTLLVLNDTRVLPARLHGRRDTGGQVELLLVEPLRPEVPEGQPWLAMGRANRPLRPGDRLHFGPLDGPVHIEAEVREIRDDGLRLLWLRAPETASLQEALEAVGQLPLPPYLARHPEPEDAERYQTVFARAPGAVAAPTAGLHFSERLLDALREAGHRIAFLTLHVGPGTFRPIGTERLEEHSMHHERYEVPVETRERIAEARAEGRTVLAVGTTVVRALEAAAEERGIPRAGPGSTNLFIRPGYRFTAVDALMTNFHLPRSTLLALVMAFGGVELVRRTYVEAVRRRYRFYSYGDAMLIV